MLTTVMHWQKLLSTARFKIDTGLVTPVVVNKNTTITADLRSDFHVDHDRIAFSSAFRCLGKKTQVHPLAQHDHIHNRLTHSVEVASVGRSLGNQVGAMLRVQGLLPKQFTPFDIGDLVQVACLAHDIGNPPFGHTGEEALRDWFRMPNNQRWLTGLGDAEKQDVSTYEGNAHSLRILTALEMYVARGGMRLTAATLGTVVKYPWTADAIPQHMGEKFNIYGTELAYFRCVAKNLGLLQVANNHWCRHPLSYLVEAADDMCYAILDLEDAVAIGMLAPEVFEKILRPLIDGEDSRLSRASNMRQRCAMMRSLAMGHSITEIARCFMHYHSSLLEGCLNAKDLISICDEPVKTVLTNAKLLANQHIYHHHNKLPTEIAVFACLGSLLDMLIPVVHNYITGNSTHHALRQDLILKLLQEHITVDKNDSLYVGYMKILDYLGLMSDNAAADLAKVLSGFAITS